MLAKFCKNKTSQKVLAIVLIITMTFANLVFLGKNLISYAFENNLELQGSDTQNSNVKFDAYLIDNRGNSVHSAIFDAANNNKINLYISVKNAGYLKEAYIDFRNENNQIDTNYEISSDTENTTLIQSVNTNLKTMSLNYIESGTEAVLEMPISIELSQLMDVSKLKQDSKVTLRGIYVNEKGKEIEISKTIKLNIGWTLETELNLEQTITKYVPYATSEGTGVILQVAIKASQNRNDIVLPVRSTQVKLKVPEIAETLPEKITITADDTIATNGNKIEFTDSDWTYDEQENTVTINAKGFEENGNVWSGIGEDKYFVTYIYPSDVYEVVNENEITLPFEAEATMELYNADGIIQKTAQLAEDITLNEKIGEIVTYSVNANQKEISKGKMYANYNTTTKTYDTEYSETIKANVSNHEIVEKLTMKLAEDNFTKVEVATPIFYSNYKQIEISRVKMQKLLGEDGYITISDGNNTYLIDKETQDVDGKYIVILPEGITQLEIETSKPIEDGILEIDATKFITKDLMYSKQQVQEFDGIKLNISGSVQYNKEGNISIINAHDTIALTETTTNAKFEISNSTFSTMVENKNVEMKIILNNNVETSDLYKNPVFTILLPKYIEEIEVTGQNILYTSGLNIDHIEKDYTENGIVLTVYTSGAEATFSDGVFTNGTNIILNTNIKVNTQTPNITDKITFEYINENARNYESKTEEIQVDFVAPEEMVTFNTILANGMESTSIDGNEQTAKLEILDSSKIATMKISLLNKYSNVCNNIRILGRIPFVGNKEISTGKDLGTTFNTELIGEINTNGIDAQVYYSANENATEDLNDEDNGWTSDFTSVNSVKSYLIVLPDYEMQVGEQLEFTYNCQVPEGLEHNESAYGTYIVYFDSVSRYIAPNLAEATKVGLTTGIGANLSLNTKAIYQGKEITDTNAVKEYQPITYKTTVANTGTVDAENVQVTSKITNAKIVEAENAAIDEQQIAWNLGTIPAGETKTVEYTVSAMNLDTIMKEQKVLKVEDKYIKINDDGKKQEISEEEYNDYLKAKAISTLTAENFDGTLEKSVTNKVEQAEFIVELSIDEYTTLEQMNKSEFVMFIKIQNVSGKAINNVVAIQHVPDGLVFTSEESSQITYNEQEKIVSINVGTLENNQSITKMVYFKANLPSGVGKVETINQVQVAGFGTDTYNSNIIKIDVVGPALKIDVSSSITNGSYIKEGNKIEITAIAQNIGEIVATDSIISLSLPNQFVVESAYYYKEGETQENLSKNYGNMYSTVLNVEKGEKVILKITATINAYGDDEQTEVKVIAAMSATQIDEVSNTLTYIVEKMQTPSNPDNPDDPTNPDKPAVPTYRITGTAWLDENEDGKKDSTEKLLEGINVLLIDAKTGVIVTDITNGTTKTVKTSSDGTYTFSNIPQGQYMVVFEYDSSYYDVTEYNKNGVTEDLSSKAIQTKINKDGVLKLAGVTNTITITDSSIANINIGLVEKPKFDLGLQKQLSIVKVENSSGTTTYAFDNTKLGKIDIPANYLNSTTVTMQYKIIVRNTGAVAGTAKKIVDYIPSDLKFDTSKNTGWYIGTDGNLYNETLANTILQPGESKELTLVLTKKMTSEETGIVTNTAEIYEDYNEYGYEDYNSKPANSAQSENDFDYVSLILTVKTGQTVLYITITLISITIMAIGIYFINKKVLKGGRI